MKRICKILIFIFMVELTSCSLLVNDFKNLNRSVAYQVQNYYESTNSTSKNVNDMEFDLEYTSEVKIGYPQDEIPSEREGFEFNKEKSGVVKENGSTFLRNYYTRKEVTLTFKASGGIWITPIGTEKDDKEATIEGKYGTKVVEPDTKYLTRNNYNFKGWDSKVPEVFPLSNETFTAQWASGAKSELTIDTTKKDIELSYEQDKKDSKTYTFTVTVPYDGDWNFEWYIDKNSQGVNESLLIETFSPGSHEISVIAKEGVNTFNKSDFIQVGAKDEEIN